MQFFQWLSYFVSVSFGRTIFGILFLAIFTSGLSSQSKIRSGIFLHHSTGSNIWGPNGSSTSIPQQIALYNATHSYSGSDAVSLNESGWPVTPWDNEWERWHRIFYNMDTVNADIRPILAANKIVMIKSCFPSSNMWGGAGTKADTANWNTKSVTNYKWHWRKIIERMRQYPSNFFVIWTNAALVASATNSTEATNANWFCRWAKDTLAEGMDTEFGVFPKNVYVFDFFHKLADANWRLPLQYAVNSGDSHPNATATLLVAPVFVQEVFNAAQIYENEYALPVSLNGFAAHFDHASGNVNLHWKTETEVDCYGFEVERRRVDETTQLINGISTQWLKVGFVSGNGTSNAQHKYSFTDEKHITGRYAYRLKQIDNSGAFKYEQETQIEISIPKEFTLSQNYPNPFNPSTTIHFGLPARSIVCLVVYNALGQVVKELINAEQQAGYQSVVWNTNVSSGLYFYRLDATSLDGPNISFVKTKTMLLLK
jgi:hypothetical protein